MPSNLSLYRFRTRAHRANQLSTGKEEAVGTRSNFQIREASDGDRDGALAVTLAAYEEYAAMMPRFAWEEYRQNIVSALSGEGPPAERIVAEQGGIIVGSALLYPAGTVYHLPDGRNVTLEWPEVRLVAVAPAARGQGIAKALMEECVRRARQSGVDRLTLHTTDMMQIAMQMYEKLGFVRMPEIDFHPAPEVTIKGYRLDLDG
jgi:GNAT superfamily N-acetyltransferase